MPRTHAAGVTPIQPKRQFDHTRILLLQTASDHPRQLADGDAQAKRQRREPTDATAHADAKKAMAKSMPKVKKRNKINPRLEIHLNRFGFHSKHLGTKKFSRKMLEDAYIREMTPETPDSLCKELTRSFRYIMKIVRNPQDLDPTESSYSSDLD